MQRSYTNILAAKYPNDSILFRHPNDSDSFAKFVLFHVKDGYDEITNCVALKIIISENIHDIS